MLHGTQPPFFQEFDRARFVPSSACHTTATCRMALLKSQATATPICELWHHASDGRMRPIWCAAQRARRRLRTVQSEPVARELQRAISIPPACRRLAVLRHVSPLSSRSVTARHHRTGIFHFFLHHELHSCRRRRHRLLPLSRHHHHHHRRHHRRWHAVTVAASHFRFLCRRLPRLPTAARATAARPTVGQSAVDGSSSDGSAADGSASDSTARVAAVRVMAARPTAARPTAVRPMAVRPTDECVFGGCGAWSL